MNRFLHILSAATIAAATIAAPSCTMMEDDVKDCPTGLYVRFVYDYNTARSDMFRDHVGHVRLYVYDEDGRKVAERTVSNDDASQPLRSYGYALHFADGELAPGRYRIQAVATQRDWDDLLKTPGAKYRRNNPETHDQLAVVLDHADQPIGGTSHHAVSAVAPLDTLWHTLKVTSYAPTDGVAVPDIPQTRKPYSVYPLADQYVTIAAERATYATVSLVRDTKHLNLTLRQIDDPANISHKDYDVYIADANSTIAHDNSLADSKTLRYTPYAEWTTRFGADGDVTTESFGRADSDDLQRTAHYNLMFNRLVHLSGNDFERNAKLMVVNRQSGKTVAEITLPSMLAEGRMAYEMYNYSSQEYLDREYDYHLDLLLKGDTWKFCDIVINVLGWSKRTQNEDL